MEDFGDLLYIVFAIIGIVYSLMKKNSRKAEQATPPIMSEDEEGETFDEPIPGLEKELSDEPGIEQPKPVFVQEHAMQREPDRAMEEKKRQMEKTFTRIKSTQLKPEIKEEEWQKEPEGIDFDLRKAVVYSEILKRPEY
ncbi:MULTISPECIES: hypothetical protein [unclassified Saccharicrinis]|uniref:hypothetical protein n=1 Tax=unclassified Saccharicrinis TaxID=2646859 RepID=UPI003D356103